MASSEDAEAHVKVLAKHALSQGHRYGPFKGRLITLSDWDEEIQMGAIKVPTDEENVVGYRFESNDFTIPMWLRFIKPATKIEDQTITLVQLGYKYFFEVTKDIVVGTEHFIYGRKNETPPSEVAADGTPIYKRRGRPKKKKLTPEEQAAKDAEEAQKKTEQELTKEKEELEVEIGIRGRARKCVICSKRFTSSATFMKHRQMCGSIQPKHIYADVENSADEVDEEEEAEAERIDEDFTEEHVIAQLDDESVPNETIEHVDSEPSTPAWPSGFKRPRDDPGRMAGLLSHAHGRERKEGSHWGDPRKRPPSDEEEKPIKFLKDECIPIAKDPEKYPFECAQCERGFSTQSWLDFHMEQHTNLALAYFVCSQCDEAFRFLTAYNTHMEEKHSDLDRRARVLSEKFRCDMCKKSFRSPIHLERHRRRANQETPYPKGPVQIKCKFCVKSFTGEFSLENHTVKKHPEFKRHQCTENNCELTFDSKDERSLHLQSFHGTDPKQIYRCPVENCIKAYTSMAALNYHYELRHTASRPFTCEICGKTWVKLGKLREHLKTHSSEKNELCDLCGRAFKTRTELKDHKMDAHTDTGREKLQCRFCTASFSRRSSRSYHERRHRNDAPYVCPKPGCNKSFVAVIDFKRHLIYHTGAKLYRCRYCSNCFTRSDYLKGHERRHHLRGEQITVAPPIEETVTIKVPWPMEKAVKIQGQNVVVIIEPDPTLAEGELTAEALAALEGISQTTSTSGDDVEHMQIQLSESQHQVVTTVGHEQDTDIVQQAAQQAIQPVDTTATQLLQLAAEQASGSTAGNVIQHGEDGEMVVTSLASGNLNSSQILMQAATQRLLQEGSQLSMSNADVSEISIDAATSEQAALVLQQLAGENAQVVLQPSEDGSGTMHATLHNEW